MNTKFSRRLITVISTLIALGVGALAGAMLTVVLITLLWGFLRAG